MLYSCSSPRIVVIPLHLVILSEAKDLAFPTLVILSEAKDLAFPTPFILSEAKDLLPPRSTSESPSELPASVILVLPFMATRTPKTSPTSTTLLDAPNSDRERVFDLFRHWGYLEADLDPLGLFRPQP